MTHLLHEIPAAQDKVRNAFTCSSFNWIAGPPADPAAGGELLQCKVRHGPNMYPCMLEVGTRLVFPTVAGACCCCP